MNGMGIGDAWAGNRAEALTKEIKGEESLSSLRPIGENSSAGTARERRRAWGRGGGVASKMGFMECAK